MAQGLYRWRCGCEGRFDGLLETVTRTCDRHPNGSRTIAHRYEPEDNGAVKIKEVKSIIGSLEETKK